VRRFVFAPEAERDLDQIETFLVERAGSAVARGVLRKIVQGFRFLAAHPLAGHVREDLLRPSARLWPVYSYVIIYEPSTPIKILRVIHGARDVTKLV